MTPTVYSDRNTEPTIVADCGSSGHMVSATNIPMQAGNNIHYTAGRLQQRKKAVSFYR